MTTLSHEVHLPVDYDVALARVQEALRAEGFGVLTRIDIHEAFREKLGVDFRRFTILGACNPPLAFKALSHRPDAGMLLPCNVTVEEGAPGQSVVRIVDADAMMRAGELGEDAVLAEVGADAGGRLARVAAALAS